MSSPSIGEPISYTVKEACRVSGLGKSLLYEAMKDGRLAKRKVGSRTLIMREDLLKLIEGGKDEDGTAN